MISDFYVAHCTGAPEPDGREPCPPGGGEGRPGEKGSKKHFHSTAPEGRGGRNKRSATPRRPLRDASRNSSRRHREDRRATRCKLSVQHCHRQAWTKRLNDPSARRSSRATRRELVCKEHRAGGATGCSGRMRRARRRVCLLQMARARRSGSGPRAQAVGAGKDTMRGATPARL